MAAAIAAAADHDPYGFSMWMAGGGIRGGKIIGSTDEIGFRAVEDPVHINDIHSTILALLGLDHRRLTYLFQGRNFRLTDVGGDNSLAPRLIKAWSLRALRWEATSQDVLTWSSTARLGAIQKPLAEARAAPIGAATVRSGHGNRTISRGQRPTRHARDARGWRLKPGEPPLKSSQADSASSPLKSAKLNAPTPLRSKRPSFTTIGSWSCRGSGPL